MARLFLFTTITYSASGMRPEKLSRLQNSSTFLSVVAIVACFEYRVVFHSFYHWISIYPPYSYIAVTVALYSLAGLIAGLFM